MVRIGLTGFFIECTNKLFRRKKGNPMKEAVRRLNLEYGFNLTEQEIDLVAKQAQEAALLFRPLFEVDLTNIAPLTKIDKKVKQTAAVKKGKK